MDHNETILNLATDHGIKMNGIRCQTIHGRGTGIIATRALQVRDKFRSFCIRSNLE